MLVRSSAITLLSGSIPAYYTETIDFASLELVFPTSVLVSLKAAGSG
jgi:hypothetical protein